MTTPTAPGNSLLFIVPGTLFWVLVIAGAVTSNNLLIGVAVVLAVVTIGATLTMRARAALAEGAAREALWTNGAPARARIVSLKPTGASINRNPQVDLVLEVTLPDRQPYRVEYRTYVSKLSVPRVQPECTLDVRVAVDDNTRVAIDPTL